MTVTVRPASATDAAAISALNGPVQDLHAKALPWRFKPASGNSFSPSEALQLLAEPQNLIFIAHVSEKPAGYVYAEAIRRPETARTYAYAMLYIHHISVEPRFQRMGVGRALMEAVQLAGQGLGIAIVALDTWSFNEDAHLFFEKFGLKVYNQRLWNA